MSLVLFTGDFFGQKLPDVYIEPVLRPYVDEYIAEAAERGIDVTPHINNMSMIVFSDLLEYPLLGIATKDGYTVAIASFCIMDKSILKAVVFHELTHSIFNVGHSGTGLMSPVAPVNFRQYDCTDFWESTLDEIFEGKDNFSIFAIESKNIKYGKTKK